MIACSDGARLVGYARVSTEGQVLALQLDALRNYGVANELIFTDKASGARRDRPGLDACLKELRPGDIMLVWRLDRLGKSVRHLVTLIDELRQRPDGSRQRSTPGRPGTQVCAPTPWHDYPAARKSQPPPPQPTHARGVASHVVPWTI
ncbi:MAG TPA: recombinase family protein [Planctomycetaceae bacterium]|nr:recombinase family protein [Planctomycetaceae bacterium]